MAWASPSKQDMELWSQAVLSSKLSHWKSKLCRANVPCASVCQESSSSLSSRRIRLRCSFLPLVVCTAVLGAVHCVKAGVLSAHCATKMKSLGSREHSRTLCTLFKSSIHFLHSFCTFFLSFSFFSSFRSHCNRFLGRSLLCLWHLSHSRRSQCNLSSHSLFCNCDLLECLGQRTHPGSPMPTDKAPGRFLRFFVWLHA